MNPHAVIWNWRRYLELMLRLSDKNCWLVSIVDIVNIVNIVDL